MCLLGRNILIEIEVRSQDHVSGDENTKLRFKVQLRDLFCF